LVHTAWHLGKFQLVYTAWHLGKFQLVYTAWHLGHFQGRTSDDRTHTQTAGKNLLGTSSRLKESLHKFCPSSRC
jgi:hypothetical protein